MLTLRLLAAFTLVLTACTERAECPGGDEPINGTSVRCDEATRVCESRPVRYCPCRGPECNGVGTCSSGITGVADWVTQAPSPVTHVVDGAFTGEEWSDATQLEGMFTDVYMDYRDGRLYFLNDWRSNDEGIRPECFNYFQIRFGADYIDLRVFGDGHVVVTRNDIPVEIANQGAYGFGPSPTWEVPHTIYEFSLALPASRIDVCCFDPVTSSECEKLTHEPVVVSIRASGSGVQVTREVPADVPRHAIGESCGGGAGVCVDGAQCEPSAGGATCVEVPAPDGGALDAGVSTDADVPPEDAALPI